MSKKQKAINTEVEQQQLEAENKASQGVVETKKAEKVKDNKNSKKSKDKKKPKKEKKGGIVKKTKEVASELKKVTWPTFSDVVKNTGIVIAFVLIFGLFLFGVNALLGWLVSLLV